MLSIWSFKSVDVQANRILLVRPQHLSDLISSVTSNILQAIRCSIDLGCCQGSCQAKLIRNPFYPVRGIDVLDQGDLVASRRALAGDDGRVGKEVLPDLESHISK